MKVVNPLVLVLAGWTLCFSGGFFGNPNLNRVLACAFCLLAVDMGRFKLGVVQWCFLAWLAWTIACTFFLGSRADFAFQGFNMRMEGLPTWIVITALAYAFWSLTDRFMWFVGFMGLATVYLCFKLDLMALHESFFAVTVFPKMALAAFTTFAALSFWMVNPVCVTFALPLLVHSNRAAVIALLVGIAVFHGFRDGHRIMKGKTLALAASGIALLMVAIVLSPVGAKFRALNPDTIGQGARTQWLVQASELTRDMPLTGYGMDSLSRQLKPAQGLMSEKNTVADKCHNIIYDLILSTGWIGYTLALLTFGTALGVTWLYRSSTNIACFALVCAWITFNLMNPTGMMGHACMLIGLFGIRREP